MWRLRSFRPISILDSVVCWKPTIVGIDQYSIDLVSNRRLAAVYAKSLRALLHHMKEDIDDKLGFEGLGEGRMYGHVSSKDVPRPILVLQAAWT